MDHMKKTVLEIKGICMHGANIVLNASDYTAFDLRNIAVAAKAANTEILIKGANKLTALDCKTIASFVGPGVVTFDFTE